MDRSPTIRRILLAILALNWMVAAAKIVAGGLGSSLSMVADGVHSVFDGASNIIGLIAVTAAAKAPDRDHPYGHRKFEVVGAAVIGVFLAAAAWHILEQGVHRLTAPSRPSPTLLQFAVLAVTLALNFAVTAFESRSGRRLQSAVLLADAQHTRSDVLATLAVIGALLASRFGFPIADPLIAIAIAGYIAWMAVRLILSSAQVLADRMVLDPEEVRKVVRAVDGVLECHEVRTRGTEDAVFADLRIHVDPNLPLRDAHEISHLVEAALRHAFPKLADVVIHVEPAGLPHE